MAERLVLREKTTRVISGKSSNRHDVISCVPKGSVLGPILF